MLTRCQSQAIIRHASRCRTSRVDCRRGSSLTLGKNPPLRHLYEKASLDSRPFDFTSGALVPGTCFRPACGDEEARLVGWKLERRRLDSDGPAGRKEFTQSEISQSKLDGLVIVIEGEGKAKADGAIIHRALAFISYDDRTKTFRWRAFTAEGRHTDAEAKAGTNSFEWGLEMPQGGRMRYTIKLNEKGEWFEVGEMSRDGQTWNKVFEMTLQRQK